VLKPFRALRPPPELAAQIACPPYDVVNTEEARAYARGNECCFFHISRPEIDLPPGSDEHSDEVYDLGRKNLQSFERQGWLLRDPAPAYYVYRQRLPGHSQVGIVAAASVEAYDNGLIKKHELTRPDKENDRARHICALEANDEPVFLTYRGERGIEAVLARVMDTAPEYDFVAADGVWNTFWKVSEAANAELEQALSHIPAFYIADGHHRIAAASQANKFFRDGANGNFGYFLAAAFPREQVRILDYNRVVKDLNGASAGEILKRLRKAFDSIPAVAKKPQAPREFGMYLDGGWYRLIPKLTAASNAGALDVEILQHTLLEPILGIGDPRSDKRIGFVAGARGTEELERLVDSGEYAVAFSLYPTRVEQMMAIADAGEIMPPKSTWFEPKLLSGLVLHPFF
jgi:uncharacterized protein (DUF1015 family)